MALKLTPNLRLRISDDLTANAIYNLNRIDTTGIAVTTDTLGQIKIRSRLDILLEPDSSDIGGGGLGGVIRLGDTGRDISAVEVNAQNLLLNSGVLSFKSGDYQLSIVPSLTELTENLTLRLPSVAGEIGEALVNDGEGNLFWQEVVTTAQEEHFVDIGGVDSERVSTNTAAGGDILAVAGTGFTIKPDTVRDSTIASDAAIALSKLAPTTVGRVLVSSETGEITSSETLASEMSALSGIQGNIQAQLDALGGLTQMVALWEPGDGASKTIIHGFDSRNVTVEILNIANQYATITVSAVKRPSQDTVVLTASEAPASTWLVLLNKINV